MRLARPVAALVAALSLLAPTLAAQKGARSPQDTTPPPSLSVDPLTRFLTSFSFRNLGPAAYSGRVTALAVPTPYHNTIYVGAAGGGVWKTTNGGITWQQIGDSLGVQTIGDVAVAPSDTNVVWVGTGERNSLRSQAWGNGVHKSTDGGKTWTHMGLKDTRSIGRIVIDPHDANTVYVAALGHLWGPNKERGVYKTTDGGKTWNKILFVDDSTGFVDLAMDPSNSQVLYAASWHRLRWGGSYMQGAGAGSGIYKSTDGGKSWTQLTDAKLNNGLPTDRMGRIGLAIAQSDPKIVYAMIEVDRGVTDPLQGRYGGVFRSSDAGATWTHVNDLQAQPHYYYDEIRVDPKDPEHVYVLASPLLESKDGGKTFATDSLHLVHVDHHALWIDPADPTHMLLGNDGGVYVTRDRGKAWAHMVLPIGQFYTVIVDSSVTPYRICGGLQDNGVWCGPSATRDSLGIVDGDWYSVNGGDGMWVQIPWHDPHTVYSEWQFGNMSRLDLRTWKRDIIKPFALDAGTGSGYDFRWGWTAPMLLSQHDSTVLYVGGNYLFRLTNRGDDWEILGPDMTRANRAHPAPEEGNTSYHALFSIAESPRDAKVLWTGSDDGLVWLTRDGGKTWSSVTGNFPKGAPTECFVSTIVASRHADGTAYLTYDCHSRDDYRPHVWRTTDFGKTWSEMVNGLPIDGGSYTIYEDPFNPRLLWVGTEVGVYVTVNGGQQWRRFGKNLPPVPVEKMAMSFRDRDLVLGTHGRGIWVVNVAPLEQMTDSLLAQRAHLFDTPPALQYNYADRYPSFGSRPFLGPNPPRGASIVYYLKEAQSGPVQLLITSVAGDTVKKIMAPGYAGLQQVTWDLSRDKPRPREKGGPTSTAELKRVEPGEYVVRLTVGKEKLERRVKVEAWR
jgi:photosystem II stability/assembly factor-like uncharacterized protein